MAATFRSSHIRHVLAEALLACARRLPEHLRPRAPKPGSAAALRRLLAAKTDELWSLAEDSPRRHRDADVEGAFRLNLYLHPDQDGKDRLWAAVSSAEGRNCLAARIDRRGFVDYMAEEAEFYGLPSAARLLIGRAVETALRTAAKEGSEIDAGRAVPPNPTQRRALRLDPACLDGIHGEEAAAARGLALSGVHEACRKAALRAGGSGDSDLEALLSSAAESAWDHKTGRVGPAGDAGGPGEDLCLRLRDLAWAWCCLSAAEAGAEDGASAKTACGAAKRALSATAGAFLGRRSGCREPS